MDGRLSFDVYAQITDPPWQVMHEAYDWRVSVVIGGPPHEPAPINLLQLWFKDPDVVMSLGRELVTAGIKLAAQLGTPLPDPTSSDPDSSEECSVPDKKANVVELGDQR
jgi:hypothetical protein